MTRAIRKVYTGKASQVLYLSFELGVEEWERVSGLIETAELRTSLAKEAK